MPLLNVAGMLTSSTLHVPCSSYDEVFVAATLYAPRRDLPEAGRVTVFLNLQVSEGMDGAGGFFTCVYMHIVCTPQLYELHLLTFTQAYNHDNGHVLVYKAHVVKFCQ